MRTAFGNRNGIKFTGDPRGSPLSFPPLPCWPSLSHLIKSGGLSTPCPLFFLRCDKYVFMRHREHELAGVYVRLVIQTAVFIYVQKKHVVATLFHTIHSESNVKHIVAISLHTIRKQCQTYCFYFVSHLTTRNYFLFEVGRYYVKHIVSMLFHSLQFESTVKTYCQLLSFCSGALL